MKPKVLLLLNNMNYKYLETLNVEAQLTRYQCDTVIQHWEEWIDEMLSYN